jgi:hypothetical protein
MLQIGEDDVVRVPYSLCVGAKGVSTNMTPVVYRKTKIPLERPLFRQKTGGMHYPGSQTWHKSDWLNILLSKTNSGQTKYART